MKTLFRDESLSALNDMYQRPLAGNLGRHLLNRLMHGGVNDDELAGAVKSLRAESRLTYAANNAALHESRVVSLGLVV